MKRVNRILGLALTAAGCLLQCGPQPTAGTGSEVEARTGAVCGKVVRPDGTGVQGARVRLRPRAFLREVPSAAPVHDPLKYADTNTDAHGCFCFDTLDTGAYRIEVNKDGDSGVLIAMTITAADTFPVSLAQDTVRRTGTITGRINVPVTDDTLRPYVLLYGVDYAQMTTLRQTFRFLGLPPGTYALRILPNPALPLFLELHDIAVASDSLSDVGTLNLPVLAFFKGCGSYACDSLVVREILDVNGLPGQTVDRVTLRDSVTGRVVALMLARRGVTSVPASIGGLSDLVKLDLRGNAVGQLPGTVGYLTSLRELLLDSNSLASMPAEAAYLDSLHRLSISNNNLTRIEEIAAWPHLAFVDLAGNNLTELPDELSLLADLDTLLLDDNALISLCPMIEYLPNLSVLSVHGNGLCTLSFELKVWLDRMDPGWEAAQACP